MSDKKISQLTGATTPLTGTEELAIVQGGSTVKATAQDVADLAPGVPYTSYTARIIADGSSTGSYILYNDTGRIFTWNFNAMLNILDVNLSAQDYQKVYVNATTLNGNQLSIVSVVNIAGDTDIQITQWNLSSPTGAAADYTLPIHVEIRIYP